MHWMIIPRDKVRTGGDRGDAAGAGRQGDHSRGGEAGGEGRGELPPLGEETGTLVRRTG